MKIPVFGKLFRKEEPEQALVRRISLLDSNQYRKWFEKINRSDFREFISEILNFREFAQITESERKVIMEYCKKRGWKINETRQKNFVEGVMPEEQFFFIEDLKSDETREVENKKVMLDGKEFILKSLQIFKVELLVIKDTDDYFWVSQKNYNNFKTEFYDLNLVFKYEMDMGGKKFVDFYKCDDLAGLLKFLDVIQK